MEFSGRKRKIHTSPHAEHYAHALQFYEQPPTENICLSEFETFAVDRVKLLKTVENLGLSYVKMSDDYNKKLNNEAKVLNFPYRPDSDHISHFILRLAYCQTEDLRRWFIQQEVDLFRYRFNDLGREQKLEFLHRNNLQYNAISDKEKVALKDQLISSSYGLSGVTIEHQDFYKVPFQDALDLVRARKVYLQAGYVYIPHQDIITIVLNDFRTKLSKALALTARSLPAVHSDERLQPLLNHLSHAYVGQDYSFQKNVGKISLEQIDSLSGKSYPLCMRQLHQAVRENHHLRHGGRMQYGLFLKGIGLSLEQALQFWKSEFIRGKVDADKFDKAYAYSIRHMFGKEGKRTDYTPYSCMKVILSNPPSQGDHHGCPFRHSDPELLKQKLQFYKVSPSGIEQVGESNFSLNHPNQYFIESQRVLSGGKDIKREMETPQRLQENSAGSTAAREAANASQDLAGMTDLDSIFQDP
uniref:DNA primase large subunit n=1 Tax=Echeneis naucrates TaxID=173247 RepID=A0A665X786_ECHNA